MTGKVYGSPAPANPLLTTSMAPVLIGASLRMPLPVFLCTLGMQPLSGLCHLHPHPCARRCALLHCLAMCSDFRSRVWFRQRLFLLSGQCLSCDDTLSIQKSVAYFPHSTQSAVQKCNHRRLPFVMLTDSSPFLLLAPLNPPNFCD